MALCNHDSCQDETLKKIFGIFKPPSFVLDSNTFAAILGLLPSQTNLYKSVLISSKIDCGTSSTVAGYVIRESARELMTVTFPFKESFLLDHWLNMFFIALTRGVKFSSLLVVLLFGRGKISSLMGDVAKGIKSFKKGMASDATEDSETKNISDEKPTQEGSFYLSTLK